MISEPGTAILLASFSSMGVSNKLIYLIKNKKCLQRIPGFIFLLLLVNNIKKTQTNKFFFFPSLPFPRTVLIFEGAARYFKL